MHRNRGGQSFRILLCDVVVILTGLLLVIQMLMCVGAIVGVLSSGLCCIFLQLADPGVLVFVGPCMLVPVF